MFDSPALEGAWRFPEGEQFNSRGPRPRTAALKTHLTLSGSHVHVTLTGSEFDR